MTDPTQAWAAARALVAYLEHTVRGDAAPLNGLLQAPVSKPVWNGLAGQPTLNQMISTLVDATWTAVNDPDLHANSFTDAGFQAMMTLYRTVRGAVNAT
jgi:hypothetical protein